MEQDEDLLLDGPSYVPVLLELAGDQACPKAYYALCILCQSAREAVLHGKEGEMRRLGEYCMTFAAPATDNVAAWRDYVRRLLDHRTAPLLPVGRARARAMGADLLLGIGRTGQVNLLGLVGTEWQLRLVTSIAEDLFVHRDTGAWRYERSGRPSDAPP